MAKTILVVDDEPEIAKMIASRLGASGYDMTVANGGEEALRKVQIVKPDLIILDVVMPDLDGGEVCARLRQDEKTREIPIIFLTALKTKEDDVNLGKDIGRHTIFAKPFDPKELLGTVREMLAAT